MSTTHSPAVAGKPPAAGPPAAPKGPPPRAPLEIAFRAAVSGALLIAYFVLSQDVINGFESALRAVLGYQPEPAIARVVAVTLLGVLLVAVWWKVVRSDPRFHAPILITYILAVGNATYGILDNHNSPEWLLWLTGGRLKDYSPTFVAILATLAIEMVLSRLIRGNWPAPTSPESVSASSSSRRHYGPTFCAG